MSDIIDEILKINIPTEAAAEIVRLAQEHGDKEIPLPVFIWRPIEPSPEIMEWARQQYLKEK